jgi:hypothetical protein
MQGSPARSGRQPPPRPGARSPAAGRAATGARIIASWRQHRRPFSPILVRGGPPTAGRHVPCRPGAAIEALAYPVLRSARPGATGWPGLARCKEIIGGRFVDGIASLRTHQAAVGPANRYPDGRKAMNSAIVKTILKNLLSLVDSSRQVNRRQGRLGCEHNTNVSSSPSVLIEPLDRACGQVDRALRRQPRRPCF